MKQVILKSRPSERLLSGHPWIFGNELAETTQDFEGGEIVELLTPDKKFFGRGYYNAKSQIRIRLLSREKELINQEFFTRRIQKAWEYRQKLGYTENARIVFGEADFLPQLIIDKFNDYLVIQTLALGIDKWKPEIVAALQGIFQPKGIYERNDVPVRELEGMPQQKGILLGDFDTRIQIRENGLLFNVDLANGQKTGYFLDQQDNRRQICQIVKDAEVLGAFTYTGSFEVHAAHYGAKSVIGIDISENAVKQANANAALNNLQGRCRFEADNVFDRLKNYDRQGERFDVVMLDPPSFAKSRAQVEKAAAGYKEINLRAMKLIRPGGFLVTSSCTNLISPQYFLEIVQQAAKDARRITREICYRSQSADHPVIRQWENTHYLKFLIIQVL